MKCFCLQIVISACKDRSTRGGDEHEVMDQVSSVRMESTTILSSARSVLELND